MEDHKAKTNFFELVRLEKKYFKINNQIKTHENHEEQIAFIDFCEKLNVLRRNVEISFEKELLFIEFMKSLQKEGLYPEEKLL